MASKPSSAAAASARPTKFTRGAPAAKDTTLTEVRKLGFESWGALDMAIHLQKFGEAQRAMEESAKKQASDEDAASLAKRKRDHDAHLARAREAVEFINSWMDQGCQDWKANRKVKKDRIKRDLGFQTEFLEKQATIKEFKNTRHSTAALEGVAWFTRNMEKLGLDQETTVEGLAIAEPAMVYLRRIEAKAALLMAESDEAAEFMASLREKASHHRLSRLEREKRRLKMLNDQSEAQVQLEINRKDDDAAAKAANDAMSREESVAVEKAKTEGKAEKLKASEDRVALVLEERERALDLAFSELSRTARLKERSVVVNLSAERKRAKAHEVAMDTTSLLVELALNVVDTRGSGALMRPKEWRELKSRFVSGDHVAAPQEESDDEGGEDELVAYQSAAGAWALASDERGFWDAKEAGESAVLTVRALMAGEKPTTRPEMSPLPLGTRLCVSGAQATEEAVAAAALLWGLTLVTFGVAEKEALRLVDAAEAQKAAESAGAPPLDVDSELHKLGVLLKAGDTDLQAKTVACFLATLPEEASYVVGGFRTKAQAKLLEAYMCNFTDSETVALIAEKEDKKKKKPKAKAKAVEEAAEPPAKVRSLFTAVLILEEAAPEEDQPAPEEDAVPAPEEEVEDVSVDGWWRGINDRVALCRAPSADHEQLAELVDVFVELSPDKELDVADGLARRVLLLSEAQRIWRSVTVTKELSIFLETMQPILTEWASLEKKQRKAVNKLAECASESVKATAASRLGQTAALAETMGRRDPAWLGLSQSFQLSDQTGELKQTLEEQLGDAVDRRRRDHSQLAETLSEETQSQVSASLEVVEAKAEALLKAETQRFKAALKLLEAYSECIDKGSATTADAAVAAEIIAASIKWRDGVVLPLEGLSVAFEEALTPHDSPIVDLEVVLAHFLRRVQSTVALLSRTRAALEETTGKLKTELTAAVTGRMRAEHRAVQAFAEACCEEQSCEDLITPGAEIINDEGL